MTRTKLPTLEFEPGTYQLAKIVQNPSSDGRKRNDWRYRAFWPAGTSFVVSEEQQMMPNDLPDVRVLVLSLNTRGTLYRVHLFEPQAHAIIPHLVAVVEKPSDWLKRQANGNFLMPEMFDRLVADGKLSRADFEAAYVACIDAEVARNG